MQQPAAGAGTRTPQPSTGQLRDRIDMQQAARGTGMQRSRAHQQPAAGGQGTEVAEMIVDVGQQRGRIDMQPLSTGTRAETRAAERSTNLALRDQLRSTGQQQGNIDMQQEAGGTGVKRQRVQRPVAEGSQAIEAHETLGAAGGQQRTNHVKPALAGDTGKAVKKVMLPVTGGKGTEAEDDALSTDLTTRDQRLSAGQSANGEQQRGPQAMAADNVAAAHRRINLRAPKNKQSKRHKNSLKSGDTRKLDQGLLTKKPE